MTARSPVTAFRYAAGYSPDAGKTQWVIAARSMKTLKKAWYAISGQELPFDERSAVVIKVRKRRQYSKAKAWKEGA